MKEKNRDPRFATQINLRLSVEEHAKLKKYSTLTYRNVNSTINYVLNKFFKEEGDNLLEKSKEDK